ncbi:MAG: hypothetical protein K5770_02680 [Lachnospiraceae bacterium]|nr:hypothetical protein [Lachnospiraceae bacterium]
MNAEIICWYICFVAGLFLFIYGIRYLFRKKGLLKEDLARASLYEFSASVIMYFPEELYNDIPPSFPFLHVVESFFTALLRTFNIYLGNGYERVTCEGHPVFSGFYATLMTIANIVLLLFVVGFIIQFFDGPVQKIRLLARRKRHAYLFPCCNEKTIAIAQSINDPEKSLIFLCDKKELSEENKTQIEEIKGIYLCDTPSQLLRRLPDPIVKLEIFLFGDSEEDNLSLLKDICSEKEKFSKIQTRIYVELSDTPWSLYDDFLKEQNSESEKLIVNFIRTEENFAYNNLLKHSIFAGAKKTDPKKRVGKKPSGSYREIGFLLVGMNERNLEMFKAVLHLSQMPGYRLNVLVVEDGPWYDGWNELEQKIPEIHECEKEGNALYKINYFDHTDFASGQLEEYVDGYLPDFNFAFVNAGDDLLNLRLALRLQAYCVRSLRKELPHIEVNLLNQKICEHWSSSLTADLTMVGDISKTYDYQFITMSDIEKGTVAIHKVRYPGGDPSWVSYCNNEYNRHSVYARTLSFKYKVQLIDKYYNGDYSITSESRLWKIYEHMRWNVYTRTLGYRKADSALLDSNGKLDKTIRGIAKVHNDLVDFDELSKEEQDKDALKLTPEIVEILKSI